MPPRAMRSSVSTAIPRNCSSPVVRQARRKSENHRERPAAVTGEHLHRTHVDVVEVGPLLAVDLDAYEQVVHERGDPLVLERLVLHDVAPVARRVAYTDEDGLVLTARAVERL